MSSPFVSSRCANVFPSSRKLTQPHLTMNNIFPPINGHSRPPSEDLRAVGSTDIQSSTQKNSQPFRRSSQQNSMEQQQQRRTPLRSTSLLPSTGTRYVTAAAAAAAAVATSSATGSPLLRSPSFVQTAGTSTQFEPAKSKCEMPLHFLPSTNSSREKLPSRKSCRFPTFSFFLFFFFFFSYLSFE